MRKKLCAAAICAVMASLFTGKAAVAADPPASVDLLTKYTNCDSDGNPRNPNLKVAFAQTDLNTPWRVAELKDFQLWAEKLCIPHFIWNEADEDVSKQLSNVGDLLAQKPDVLLLDPIADQPLIPAIQMARKAGVPMIDIDRALSVGPGPDTYLSVIDADNFTVGISATKAWIEKLKQTQHTDSPKATLLIIMGGVGEDPAIERDRGVETAIKLYPNIKILAIQSGDWTRDGGRKVMEGYLQRFAPGTIQGVYAAADEMMIGARQAVEAVNRKDFDGVFFSGDGQLQGLEAVADGFDVADSQFSPLYGEAGLNAAIAVSQGERLLPHYWLQLKTFTCITQADCDATKEYVAQLKATGMQF